MSRHLYSLLVRCLLPFTVLYLLWRGRKQPEYRQHWRERFAVYPNTGAVLTGDAVPKGDAIPPRCPVGNALGALTFWLHAVSVGETRAAEPLIKAMQARWPEAKILITHTTPTGRATSVALFGERVERCYLPYDTPGIVARFLRHHRPTIGVIMETELWPNLVAATHASGIPTLLVNARLSERSAKGYQRFARLSSATLRCLHGIGAQTAADAGRLKALGAEHLSVTGNIKFDISPPDEMLARGATLRERAPDRQIFLCASTREGEEDLILDAWAKVSAPRAFPTGHRGGMASPVGTARASGLSCAEEGSPPLLVIVPRHPQRFDAVTELAASKGFSVQRRSANQAIVPITEVLIGDSMGEMFAYYAAADVAFVGGSLLDFGCQNLIEPCSIGTPVLIGPSTYNFAEAAAEALACGAAVQIAGAEGLVSKASELLADETRRRALGAAGIAFTQKHRGATARTLRLIDAALSEGALSRRAAH